MSARNFIRFCRKALAVGKKMSLFTLSSDSCCDTPAEDLAARGICSISLQFIEDDNGVIREDSDDFIGDKARLAEFYRRVAAGMQVKTSQLTMHTLTEYFRELVLRERKDVVHITLSSGLSGTYDQAVLAAKTLKEELPEYTVHVVDSLSATVGQRLLLEFGEKLRDSGKSAAETAAELETKRLGIHHWIIIDDLNHLKRGGRVSGAAAAVGTLLNLKPFLVIDEFGGLKVLEKNKGMKKSFHRVLKTAEKWGNGWAEGFVYVVHTAAESAANELAEQMRQATGAEVRVVEMGPVIGAHVGPGTVACAYFGKERKF